VSYDPTDPRFEPMTEEEFHQQAEAYMNEDTARLAIRRFRNRHELPPIPRLADRECAHERLPGDKSPPCGCWEEAA
jgi:hypothetical protein